MTDLQKQDKAFARKLAGAVATVQAWEDDPSLLQECRVLLPWEALRDERGIYADYPQDHVRLFSPNARFVNRMARWFKRDFMTWVNNPPCALCASPDTRYETVRSAETAEEEEGQAKRVEVYWCETCDAQTTVFPRFQAPRKLLGTRRGRCGELANLFGLLCRAVGLETRYILDVTDHVWTEVRVGDDWLMVDSCEGVVDEPSVRKMTARGALEEFWLMIFVASLQMYEAGWGKKLIYIVAVAADHCCEVTWRYTRQGHRDDFEERRRLHCSSEVMGEGMIREEHERLVTGLTSRAQEDLQKRLAQEAKLLSGFRQLHEWTEDYGQGRISGSLQPESDLVHVDIDLIGGKTDEAEASMVKYLTKGRMQSKESAFMLCCIAVLLMSLFPPVAAFGGGIPSLAHRHQVTSSRLYAEELTTTAAVTSSVKIRDGLYGELGDVADIIMDSFYTDARPPWTHMYRLAELNRLQQNFPYAGREFHRMIVALAEIDGEKHIAGFCDIDARKPNRPTSYKFNPRPYLSDLCVAPTFRRKGVARSLIDHCEQFCRDLGKSDIFIRVERRNDAAIKMYTDMGYQEIENLLDDSEIIIVLQKSLDST
jgi:peptide-N4-(N-acetyl-beta-glucosaminyl)asparagine amidase